RERLGGLESGGGLGWPEHRASSAAQAIGEPSGERGLRSYDDEVDPSLRGRRDERVHRGCGDGEIGAEEGGTGVAGSGEQGRLGGVARERPAQRMLAAAPADDQDPHFFLNVSENACAARLALSTTSCTTAFASFT